jgi:penicillin-binding protein
MISRRLPIHVAALVAVVAMAGCATDNPVASLNPSIDTAPPSAPTNIRSEARGAVALLAWDASSDADVVGYDVYRYAPDPARESAYVRINASTISAEEYVVSDPAAWYRVKAVDLSGNRSSSSGAAYVVSTMQIVGEDPIDVPPVRRN